MPASPVAVHALDVLLFAAAADALGGPMTRVALDAAATAGDVRRLVAGQADAAGAALLGRCRVAVNQRFADDAQPVAPGDEVALIPPVAGG